MALNKKSRPVSEKQQRIVKFILQEYSYPDIKGEMCISYNTVVTHVTRLKLRYKCSTLVGIAVRALNDGFTYNMNTREVFYMGKVIR